MTPQELALRHPRLYHVTTPDAWKNIQQKGLLSTAHILDLYQVHGEHRAAIEMTRRTAEVRLEHIQYGPIVINDNIPLTEQALAKCLDGGLTPPEWLRLLNARVFFWPSEKELSRLLTARLNRNRVREVIVIDTLSLAEAHGTRMELSPINSGATLRKAARRGLQTFTPLLHYSYEDWRKLRGHCDTIREITVRGAVMDITNHVIEVYHTKTDK